MKHDLRRISVPKMSLLEVTTLTVLCIGIALRFYHLLYFDFLNSPYRLGGLFLAFSEQIASNDFRLPYTIPFYSEGGIPFAYPPLAFYIEALLLRLFHESRFGIVNLLPPIISGLTLVGAFRLFQTYFQKQKTYVLAATFAYAFLPPAFVQQTEAAGLSESFGSFSMVLIFGTAIRYSRQESLKNAVLFGLAVSLAVLSSPGSAIGAAAIAFVYGVETLLRNRFKNESIIQMSLALFTALLTSAPYWFTVMLNHGRGIFIVPVLSQYSMVGKQNFLLSFIERLLNFRVVQDGSIFLWNAIIFFGVLWLLSHGKFKLLIDFLILFSIPRESSWLVALPAALVFSYGFNAILATLYSAQAGWKTGFAGLIMALFAFWMVISSFGLIDDLIADRQWKISPEQIKIIEQSRTMIPENAKVLVLGNDALLEWSPYLLQREVINTKFGLEWQPHKLETITSLNEQINHADSWDEMLAIIEKFTGRTGIFVLSADKKYLTQMNRVSGNWFVLKLETPEIQLGVLGTP